MSADRYEWCGQFEPLMEPKRQWPPIDGVTPIQAIVVAFVVSSLTMLFWRGVGYILGFI